MTAKLDKPLKREVDIDGSPFTVTVAPEGVTIVQKGRRKGRSMTWKTLISGDADLSRDLNISLDAFGNSE